MFKYHLKFALRNFLRNRTNSLINIMGLSIGIAAALLIFLWVKHEYSINRFHKNSDVLYRIMVENTYQDPSMASGEVSPALLGQTIKDEIPEIVNANTRTYQHKLLIKKDSLEFKESMIFSDPSLFEMFSFPMKEGSFEPMKKDPHSVVISERLARLLFGNQRAVGQSVRMIDDNYEEIGLTVTGVYYDMPEISTIKPDFVVPFDLFVRLNDWTGNWGNSAFYTTIQLQPGADVKSVNEKITGIYRKRANAQLASMFIVPYKDSYLKSMVIDENKSTGKIIAVRIFICVAIFTLLIACINFMNLSTARASKRMREIGVKKVIGVRRVTLMGQFFSESIIMSAAATVLAFILIEMAIPLFNSQLGYHLSVPYRDPYFLILTAGICLITGLFSGSYPAVYLSSVSPSQIIRGSYKKGRNRMGMRELLVVFQFAMSIFMITGTVILFKQIRYIMNRDIGMDRENVVRIPVYKNIDAHRESFKDELASMPGVISSTYCDQTPFSVGSATNDPHWPGKPEDDNQAYYIINTDNDFVKTLGLKIREGHDFTGNFKSDSAAFLINEEALKSMDLKDPLGTPVTFWGVTGTIIGVVKDFNNQSMHGPIHPLIIRYDPGPVNAIFVKITGGNLHGTIDNLTALYKKFEPGYPFEYTFLDDSFAQQYKMETLIGKLSLGFSGLSIFIACLGLMGLSAFMAEQRTKEIGIRKTFGASVSGLVVLLSGKFTRLVLIAFLISIPGVYFLMKAYLNTYSFRIDLHPWFFIAGGLLALVISWLTVSYQSIRAARRNPVEVLRYE